MSAIVDKLKNCIEHCKGKGSIRDAHAALSAEALAEIEFLRAAEQDKAEQIPPLRNEIERLTRWVSDLQAGMYVNCVYCGHRYGPGETTPVSMADALKAHVEQCPEHPMSALKRENQKLRDHIDSCSCNCGWNVGMEKA